jgi:hypothetical protein
MQVARVVTEDKVVTVTTTVREESRWIDYADLLDCVEVKPDEWCDAPWDNCCGYGHETRPISYYDHDDMLDNAAHVARACRETLVVEFDNATEKGLDDEYRWYRSNGASKQVAAELVAQNRAARMEALIGWIQDGWEYWYVCAEYNGYEAAGCGGIDDYDYADTEYRRELADELAYELEKDGFVIIGKPDPAVATVANRKDELTRKINMFNRR